MPDAVPASPNRAGRLLVAGFAVALASVWLIPGGPVNENRVLRDFPELTPGTVASAAAFAGIDGALVDHLPAKSVVVSGVSSALVGAGLSPVNTVFRGPSGEPFYAIDLNQPCAREAEIPGLLDRLSSLTDAWSARGTRLVYAIAPDKSSVERADLGPLGPSVLACSDRVRSLIQAAANDSLLVAWDEFGSRDDLYSYGDTHWNWAGSVEFARLLVNRIQPGLFDDGAVHATGIQQHSDDLFTIMGAPRVEPIEELSTLRPGVHTEHEADTTETNAPVQRWTSTSTGPALIPGRTLVLTDSFFGYDVSVLPPYFEDLTAVPIPSGASPSTLALLDSYDLVIVQQVQRNALLFLENMETADWMAR